MNIMRYTDMHCDTLTECLKSGADVEDCQLQINLKKLRASGCAAQCFAIFTQGDGAAEVFENSVTLFNKILLNSESVLPVRSGADLLRAKKSGLTGCILTVENLGFIGGDVSKIKEIAAAGVRMASLVWNEENLLAYPNLIFEGGVPDFGKREKRGLKPSGREAAEALDEQKIIIDISHLSDGGARELLDRRKIPLVASHSNAERVCAVSRNLTDALIKKIADCGGVIGVNFCKDFLGEGSAFGQILKHILYIIGAGGEDVIAFGSDFDGIPAYEEMKDCLRMPSLIQYLNDNGISGRVLEKLCFGNFARVFGEVCG